MKSSIDIPSSKSALDDANDPMDRLSSLLERFRIRTSLFYNGQLCGRSVFEAQPERAFLHVLRRGALEVLHPGEGRTLQRIVVTEPSLLLCPRSVHHEFINPPRDGSDFTCATVYFEGGDRHPIVSALPNFLLIPLQAVEGLSPALDLLFSETDRARSGSRLLADRLFEVVLIQVLRWIIDHPGQVGVASGLIQGLSDARLARALMAVHQAPQEDWTLSRMAAAAGMSRSAFAPAFKQALGVTPAAYLTDWRLTVAATQLRLGHPQKIVAADLGFATGSSLSASASALPKTARAISASFGERPSSEHATRKSNSSSNRPLVPSTPDSRTRAISAARSGAVGPVEEAGVTFM